MFRDASGMMCTCKSLAYLTSGSAYFPFEVVKIQTLKWIIVASNQVASAN